MGKNYAKWKTGEKDKDKDRKTFFALALEDLQNRTLGQRTISLADVDEIETESEAREWVALHYPKWNLKEIKYTEDDVLAILEEDPQYIDFTYTNPQDGMVYRRQVVDGGSMMDVDRLQEEAPDLWERITVEETRRVPKPSSEWDKNDYAAVQKFTYPGKPQIKLAPPTEAKDEDESDDDAEEN